MEKLGRSSLSSLPQSITDELNNRKLVLSILRPATLSRLGLFILTLTLAIGCGGKILVPSSHPPVAPSVTLTISAAASLQDALEAIDPLFEQTNPNIQVNYNFGSSGTLQQQIEQGAPVDVFISAAAKQMNALQEQDLILSDTRRNLLANRLVLIVPQDSALALSDFRQLRDANISRISVGEPRGVPAGQYAEEVLKNLELAGELQPKFVFANNVRGVLAAVESGNVDAGIVYETDAKRSDRVKIAAIAEENLHQPIVYPIAVLQSSSNIEAAKTYTQFLLDTQARDTFQKFGFGTPAS
ncbi:molybdate ABC transporter substrate-binding protein [filamentous cyanobacterium CCP1]|nr:molybdate ABC transporter substrate-binding protein [filamentous cyanobacterium CCP2]PSB67628.1 molybdate ABC transporter substrate-binding protein [filamentous cyanobacterium CCP1]